METLSIIFMLVAIVLLVIPSVIINNKAIFPLIIFGTLLLFFSREIAFDINIGRPASLNVLTVGEKYEVVAMYESYIVTKSLADGGIKLIGPLNFDATSVGVGDICIKTAEGSLEKFLRH